MKYSILVCFSVVVIIIVQILIVFHLEWHSDNLSPRWMRPPFLPQSPDTKQPQPQSKQDQKSNFEFSEEEDIELVQHVKKFGTQKWGYVSNLINHHRSLKGEKEGKLEGVVNSSPLLCRQRWFMHLNSTYFSKVFPLLSDVNMSNWSIRNHLEAVDDDKVVFSDESLKEKNETRLRIPAEQYPRGRLIKHNTTGHVLNGDGDRVVFYFHLHKAGGSQVCRLAKQHQWLDQTLPNCNYPGLGPMNYKKSMWKLLHGDGIYESVQSKGWKLVMSEVPLVHQLQLDHFLYAIQVRNPLNRIKSHVRFNGLDEDTILNTWVKKGSLFTPRVEDLGFAVTMGTAPFDNFLIRSLSGLETFGKLPQTINETDYIKARSILSKFECIIIMERYPLDAKIQFSRLFGWKYWLHTGIHGMAGQASVISKSSSTRRNDPANEESRKNKSVEEIENKMVGEFPPDVELHENEMFLPKPLSLEGEQKLVEINHLDYKLYEDAKLFSDRINFLAWSLLPPER